MQQRPVTGVAARTVSRCLQCGQASAEYLVVACALVIALLAGAQVPAIDALIAALKSCFSAYGFALSLP
ncbi:hypothetical protein [Paraburkholderia rhizosphaerae]|uniref:Flp pilus assembly pilin Flp n=1 Tax=Paraburkholderia rhizosphaerae TaxID=480658 RepID=A0A4V3HFQ5_9BURK|nr:hypothetical protein [Paraburkholderia rhizosphaerae]TDY54557.1 hypothetical protein BX592_10113 [Paraburkholderia rhizosphaerae]